MVWPSQQCRLSKCNRAWINRIYAQLPVGVNNWKHLERVGRKEEGNQTSPLEHTNSAWPGSDKVHLGYMLMHIRFTRSDTRGTQNCANCAIFGVLCCCVLSLEPSLGNSLHTHLFSSFWVFAWACSPRLDLIVPYPCVIWWCVNVSLLYVFARVPLSWKERTKTLSGFVFISIIYSTDTISLCPPHPLPEKMYKIGIHDCRVWKQKKRRKQRRVFPIW